MDIGNARRTYAVLSLVEQGDLDLQDSDDEDHSMSEQVRSTSTRSMMLPSVAAARTSYKRLAGVTLIAAGIAVLAASALFKSLGGPLRAGVLDSTQLQGNGTGLKQLETPAGGLFRDWKVDVFDSILHGGAVAEFELDGNMSTVTWDGPDGMVMARQKNLSAGDGLLPGAALITVAQALFVNCTVSAGDDVHAGDTVAFVQVGEEKRPILASKNGTVVGVVQMPAQEPIGFDTRLEDSSFSVLGVHLPHLPKPRLVNSSKGSNSENTSEEGRNIDGRWLAFIKYYVSAGEQVKKGDLIALAQEVLEDDTKGKEVKFEAGIGGNITHLQTLSPGEMIGPDDDLFIIVPKDKPKGFSWWLLVFVCLLCVLLALIFFLYRAQQRDPQPKAMVVTVREATPRVADVVKEPEPTSAPAPEPVADPAPEPEAESAVVSAPDAPPPGIPIYFDHKPYYFEYRPLGIKFRSVGHVKVDDFIFNSYSRSIGLQRQQRLTRIGDFDVEDKHQLSEVSPLLNDAIKDLPIWPLRIDFKINEKGEIKTFYFKEKPLGIVFTQQLPIKVDKFRPYSLAERAGVQLQWQIIRIADEDTTAEAMAKNRRITTSKAAYEHVDKRLLEGLTYLPFWSVSLEFNTPSGVQIINMSARPHGITLSKKGTVQVEDIKSGSAAEEQGIQAGWDLVRIMDDEIKAAHDHKHVEKLLELSMRHLPDKDTKKPASKLSISR